MWQTKAEREIDRERKKGEEKAEEITRRKDAELKNLKEQMKIEQDEWKESMQKKIQEENFEKIKKMKEEMVRERNREIEAIINKLGDETYDTKK